MKLLTVIAALATFTLAGCAQIWPLPIGGSQPIREEVTFEGNKIKPKSVAIVIPAGRTSATLEWQLDPKETQPSRRTVSCSKARWYSLRRPSSTARRASGSVRAFASNRG